jgi:hypothetical protein
VITLAFLSSIKRSAKQTGSAIAKKYMVANARIMLL